MVNPTTMMSSKAETTTFGIASDPLPTTCINEVEYEGWIVVEADSNPLTLVFMFVPVVRYVWQCRSCTHFP